MGSQISATMPEVLYSPTTGTYQQVPAQPQYVPVQQNGNYGYSNYQSPQANVVVVGGGYNSGYDGGLSDGDQNALFVQIIILIAGWFCCCIWAAGFCFFSHPNPTVRLIAKISACLFILFSVLTVCGLVAWGILLATAVSSVEQ